MQKYIERREREIDRACVADVNERIGDGAEIAYLIFVQLILH